VASALTGKGGDMTNDGEPNPPTRSEEPAEGSRETVVEAEQQAMADHEAHPELQSDG